jgi:hypothetical protein
MNHTNINGFVLGMGLAFGVFIYIMQKCAWELVAQKLRKCLSLKSKDNIYDLNKNYL